MMIRWRENKSNKKRERQNKTQSCWTFESWLWVQKAFVLESSRKQKHRQMSCSVHVLFLWLFKKHRTIYSLAAEVFWCLKASCQFLKLRSVRLLMSPLFIFSPQCFFPERQFDWQLTSGWTAAHWMNTILQSARLRQWRPADDWMSSCSWRRVEVVEGVCGVHPAVLRG